MPMNAPPVTDECDGLLSFLDHQRQAVRDAVYGIDDEAARTTPTASGLSLGGLVKHLAYGEEGWADRIERVPVSDNAVEEYTASFSLAPDEALGDVLGRYQRAAARTDKVARGVVDLGEPVPLPQAPWFPERCTVRWVLLHLVEETARHAGHADILREALDGALSGPLMAAAEGWPEGGWVQPWRPDDGPSQAHPY